VADGRLRSQAFLDEVLRYTDGVQVALHTAPPSFDLDRALISLGFYRSGGPPGLAKTLAAFSYKPGWHFAVVRREPLLGGPPQPWERAVLLIVIEDVLDAYGSGERFPFCQQAVVPDYGPPGEPSPGFWQHWLWVQVLAAEEHEAGEWFVIDGQRPYDPHAKRGG
jgi:hypothetical protein